MLTDDTFYEEIDPATPTHKCVFGHKFTAESIKGSCPICGQPANQTIPLKERLELSLRISAIQGF